MDQGDARKLAKEHNGIAIQGRRSPRTGEWIVGGWATKDSTWIVYDPRLAAVIFDGETVTP